MTAAKRTRRPPQNSGGSNRADAIDPRFLRMCESLAVEPRYATCVAEFMRGCHSTVRQRFGSHGLRVNGKIFAMSARGTLVVKLPATRVDALVAARKGERLARGAGRVLRKWFVATSPRVSWVALAQEAYEHVAVSTSRESRAVDG